MTTVDSCISIPLESFYTERVRHLTHENGALCFNTPEQQWAYAVDVDLRRFEPELRALGKSLLIEVRIKVESGIAGVGVENGSGDGFLVEQFIEPDDDELFTLYVADSASIGALVIRQAAEDGSPSVVRLTSVTCFPSNAPQKPIIDLDLQLIRPFGGWSGRVQAGMWANWLGIQTRAKFYAMAKMYSESLWQDRFETAEFPAGEGQLLDLIPLLEAVLSSQSMFRMLDLGAGWGRWLTTGAFACEKVGLAYQLTGVEAEPTHFKWLEEHMKDNAVPEQNVRLINAAVGRTSGYCWFPVGGCETYDPSSWYGQSIVPDAKVPGENAIAEDVQLENIQLRRTRSLSLDDLLQDGEMVDYMQIDIQGTEYDLLSACPDRLDRQVRMINIGTHSQMLERRLKRLFCRLGWTLRYEVPIGQKCEIRFNGKFFTDTSSRDGVQVWLNPRFDFELKTP